VKEEIIYAHFNNIMGRRSTHTLYFNWHELQPESPDLHSLGEPFIEDEVRCAINQFEGNMPERQ
jgi:hypothetical protein